MSGAKGFGKQNHKENIDRRKDRFDTEWDDAISRFQIDVGFKSFQLNLRHPKTREICKPHQAIPDVFKQWQTIQSLWDRRSLLYEAIYSLVGQHMKPWQVANYLTANRSPLDALDILQSEIKNSKNSDKFPEYCIALSRSLIALTYYKEALTWAQKAFQASPKDIRNKFILADAYALCGYPEEADKIYQEQLALAKPSQNNSISEMFSEMFAKETGIISSPVFAVQIGLQLSDPHQSAEFWKIAEAEFYDSPYFRMQHAYHLANSGSVEHCIAKLIALTHEMPWLKEANLKLMQIFEELNQSGKVIMPEFQSQLRKRLESNS
ncbi:lipopolysaccharide assembly protein LapB [Synechococcus sp. PCC 7336]|uniref:tetratricopeptide repeat protein n=1 Tax=Synechococcus sp. PCC 7336 TaxID=195250 RepID=UPI00035F0152|nr:hypothetical protein [Synechococcus sp. PCC 7336]